MDESYKELEFSWVGLSDEESGILPTSTERSYNLWISSDGDNYPSGYYVRLNPSDFSRS